MSPSKRNPLQPELKSMKSGMLKTSEVLAMQKPVRSFPFLTEVFAEYSTHAALHKLVQDNEDAGPGSLTFEEVSGTEFYSWY